MRLAGSEGLLEVRDGRCRLITHDQPEQDITDDVPPKDAYMEMLTAIRTGGTGMYSTAHSLKMAAALLAGRDAADEQRIVMIDG